MRKLFGDCRGASEIGILFLFVSFSAFIFSAYVIEQKYSEACFARLYNAVDAAALAAYGEMECEVGERLSFSMDEFEDYVRTPDRIINEGLDPAAFFSGKYSGVIRQINGVPPEDAMYIDPVRAENVFREYLHKNLQPHINPDCSAGEGFVKSVDLVEFGVYNTVYARISPHLRPAVPPCIRGKPHTTIHVRAEFSVKPLYSMNGKPHRMVVHIDTDIIDASHSSL